MNPENDSQNKSEAPQHDAPEAVKTQPVEEAHAKETPATSENHAKDFNKDMAKVKKQAHNFFSFMFTAVAKPVTGFRDGLAKFGDMKNSMIITAIVSVVAMLLGLITSMIAAVHTERCSLFGGNCKVSWEWDNLGDLNYFQLILGNLLVYIIMIALVAGVFFGMSRAFKQNKTNYWRMLTIVATAVIPAILCSFIGAFVSILNAIIGALVILAGSSYSFYMFYEAINDEAKITGDKKVYYNFLSVLVLLVIVCVLAVIFASGGTSTLNNSLFGLAQ